jgi:hypothetical protein
MSSETNVNHGVAAARKRTVLKLVAVLVSLLLSVIGVELVANVYLLARDRRYIPARSRLAALGNTFITDITRSKTNCRYVDTLYPHPYVAFVHHGNPPCGIANINNIGLLGPDYPSERPADRFVVLVTGGSVAAQLMVAGENGTSYLQAILNRDYVSPNGQPFLLLNGGDGAWHQPQQAILFLLYADAVHAVATLDGFNEQYMIGVGVRFEFPANNFMDVNPLASSAYADVVKRWIIGRLYARAAASPILSRSQTAYLVLARLDGYLKAQEQLYKAGERTNLRQMLALPQSWDQEHRVLWADGQYKKYIRAIDAIAGQHGVLAAHFIQPVPAIGKALTDAEKKVVGDLGYGTAYRRTTQQLLSLAGSGTPIFSLLDVFDQHRETLYADAIHVAWSHDGRSEGYRLMSERMANILAKTWSLRPKR